jgi:hypothetical protein
LDGALRPRDRYSPRLDGGNTLATRVHPSSGAAYLFPQGRGFVVGDLIDLVGEDGSWHVRSIETEPVDALPRLVLDPVEPSDDKLKLNS